MFNEMNDKIFSIITARLICSLKKFVFKVFAQLLLLVVVVIAAVVAEEVEEDYCECIVYFPNVEVRGQLLSFHCGKGRWNLFCQAFKQVFLPNKSFCQAYIIIWLFLLLTCMSYSNAMDSKHLKDYKIKIFFLIQ